MSGQDRRRWLNERSQDVYDALQYYLGPTGIPDKLNAAAELLQFTDAGDVYEAQAGAEDMRNAEDVWGLLQGAGRTATGVAAVTLPFVGAKMANNLTDAGIDWLGSAVDDVMAGYDPTRVNMGVNLNSKPMYHGTPDAREVREYGSFATREKPVHYVTDPQKWKELQGQLAGLEPGTGEYYDTLYALGELRGNRNIPAPVFLSPDRPMAASYADDARAWDYQNAEPEVIEAMTSPRNVLDIDAKGASFRGIKQDAVIAALRDAGVSQSQIDDLLLPLAHSRDGVMSTDDLAAVTSQLGFDAVDVANVRDYYTGTGPAGTVRMMLDPSLIDIPAYRATDPATTRGQEILDLLNTNPSAVTDDMLDMGDPVLNARLNEYLWNNYDLPMDEASRVARAEGMGFDGDWFHGGATDFPAFDRANRGRTTTAMSAKRATWMADKPDVAGGYSTFAEGGPVQQLIDASYRAEADGDFDLAEDLMRQAEELELSGASAEGGNIMPLTARGRRLAFDAEGEKYDANEYVMMDKVNEAQRGGYDAVQIDNFVDNADYSDWTEATHLGVFDPRNVRSRFARFDPRLAHLRNLNAGLAGGLFFGAIGLTPSEEAEIEAYLGGI